MTPERKSDDVYFKLSTKIIRSSETDSLRVTVELITVKTVKKKLFSIHRRRTQSMYNRELL